MSSCVLLDTALLLSANRKQFTYNPVAVRKKMVRQTLALLSPKNVLVLENASAK